MQEIQFSTCIDLWWLSSSTWGHSTCRTVITNSNWFLLCRHNDNGSQDTTVWAANEQSSRKINRKRCKWRGRESMPCLNESPLRASSRKPSRLREGRPWKRVEDSRRTERSDIVLVWKLGEVTLEINVLPVLHTKRISETRRPSSLHVLLHCIVRFPLRTFSNDNRRRCYR